MPNPLVECVPNFSEARRPEVVGSIVQAIKAVPGVSLLDRHSDWDHNRTVVTFIGPPEAVEEASFRAIARAAELIDLNEHFGEHPRIGATDVVPFVPISDVSMQDCIEIANRLGRRVGEELKIPVYLYERAATRAEHRRLENIRRGEYEALKEEIETNPARKPDFGPANLGPAGATIIGARPFLVAYNVYLTTDDESIAKKIARSVRHSSGGLRYVKAIGLLVDGRAQVSMNLTDYRQTPLARVVEMIRREALRYGVDIHHSELVGLIPEEALVDTAVWYTQMDGFEPDQVLEHRLYEAHKVETSELSRISEERAEHSFLEALASDEPTPGGGSAAAYSAASAAALVAMVARVTIGKKKYEDLEDDMKVVLERAEVLRAAFTDAVERDAAAFEAVIAKFRLPKGTSEEKARRDEAIEEATMNAATVPLDVAEKSLEVLELALQVISQGNINAITDGGTAASLAFAALTGSGLNVRINAANLQDRAAALELISELQSIEDIAAELEEKIWAELAERGNLYLD